MGINKKLPINKLEAFLFICVTLLPNMLGYFLLCRIAFLRKAFKKRHDKTDLLGSIDCADFPFVIALADLNINKRCLPSPNKISISS